MPPNHNRYAKPQRLPLGDRWGFLFGMGAGIYLMPARMNDCTNCRWNSKNAISSGPDVISVAAVMIVQSTPCSVAENICKPTVSGRELTELVTMSGQRKLFQCVLMETRA